MTIGIARSLNITYHFLYSSKICISTREPWLLGVLYKTFATLHYSHKCTLAKEIWHGSPDHFQCERTRSGHKINMAQQTGLRNAGYNLYTFLINKVQPCPISSGLHTLGNWYSKTCVVCIFKPGMGCIGLLSVSDCSPDSAILNSVSHIKSLSTSWYGCRSLTRRCPQSPREFFTQKKTHSQIVMSLLENIEHCWGWAWASWYRNIMSLI